MHLVISSAGDKPADIISTAVPHNVVPHVALPRRIIIMDRDGDKYLSRYAVVRSRHFYCVVVAVPGRRVVAQPPRDVQR